MDEQRPGFVRMSHADRLMPKEEMLEVAKQKGSLTIGVPREASLQEKRISLIPDGVALLVSNGHQVVIETGSGMPGHFSDHDYSEAGARITSSPEEIFRADVVLKGRTRNTGGDRVAQAQAGTHFCAADGHSKGRILSFDGGPQGDRHRLRTDPRPFRGSSRDTRHERDRRQRIHFHCSGVSLLLRKGKGEDVRRVHRHQPLPGGHHRGRYGR